MKLSLIVPVLNEEENIGRLLAAVDEAFAKQPEIGLEIVFVDDGSRDRTFELASQMAEKDPRVKVIRFSRNFGSHAALLAGFERCTGDAAAYLAADLQESPEVLIEMVKRWQEGAFIVWGTREQRDDPLSAKVFSRVYSSLMRRIALADMPKTGLDLCLIDRKVINAVVEMREKNTSIFGLILWSGFPQVFVPYRRNARKHGKSRWTMSKKVKLVADSFVAFSFFPIRLVTYLGISLSLIAFVFGTVVIVRASLGLTAVQGWASLMALMLGLSGMQLLMLGIVAEYLWRTFDESRRRPPFVIRETRGIDRG